MRACIHRGAREVGGNCVELEHEGSRIVLDLGMPLTAGPGNVPSLPRISGLTNNDPSLLGIVISHGHPDHWGMVPHVRPNAPVYLGEATQRMLREASFFASFTGRAYPAIGHFVENGRPGVRCGIEALATAVPLSTASNAARAPSFCPCLYTASSTWTKRTPS